MSAGIDTYSVRQPLGVAAGICPFNFPGDPPRPVPKPLTAPGPTAAFDACLVAVTPSGAVLPRVRGALTGRADKRLRMTPRCGHGHLLICLLLSPQL